LQRAGDEMNRREFLQLPAMAVTLGSAQQKTLAVLAAPGPRKKVAALATTYFLRSHADDVITRFLEGYWINSDYSPPSFEVVSLYMDQIHPADIGYRLSTAYNFQVVKSIPEALTLGTGKLAVDAVLLVAEHGNYPFNDRGQQLYPRFNFFSQMVETFRKSKCVVPVLHSI
jgi:hypothetical protein